MIVGLYHPWILIKEEKLPSYPYCVCPFSVYKNPCFLIYLHVFTCLYYRFSCRSFPLTYLRIMVWPPAGHLWYTL